MSPNARRQLITAGDKTTSPSLSPRAPAPYDVRNPWHSVTQSPSLTKESVCEVRTQDPENFDEEVLALVSAWCHAYPVGRGDRGPGDLWRSVTLGRAVT